MPLDFGREVPEQKKRRTKPPPNYLSRRVQWRVFMLVACFMLVIILMQEARKPKNWRWLWAFQGNQAPLDEQPAEGDVDTRLRMPPQAKEGVLGPDQVIIQGGQHGEVIENSAAVDEGPAVADALTLTPVQHARQDAWSRLLAAMPREDREHFLRGLKAERDGAELSDEDRKAWPAILDQFDSRWQDYLDKAFLAISQDKGRLTDDEKRNWLEVVEELKSQWNERVEPALRAIGDGVAGDDDRRKTIADLQSSLDAVFRSEIHDNTVFRPDEKDAWFRMLEELKARDLADIERSSTGRVGFLQLYRQPADYRGRLVTVRGAVRRGYYRPAPTNFYGIDGYYIFWLKPSGANSPIAIYCLDVPEGFPDVVAMETQGEGQPELDEDAEFTGFFFKRRAYRAVDGTRLTPVLLAKTPRWEPPPEAATQAASLPGMLFWVLVISGISVFAIGFACVVYWMGRRSSPRGIPHAVRGPAISRNDARIPAEVKVD